MKYLQVQFVPPHWNLKACRLSSNKTSQTNYIGFPPRLSSVTFIKIQTSKLCWNKCIFSVNKNRTLNSGVGGLSVCGFLMFLVYCDFSFCGVDALAALIFTRSPKHSAHLNARPACSSHKPAHPCTPITLFALYYLV